MNGLVWEGTRDGRVYRSREDPTGRRGTRNVFDGCGGSLSFEGDAGA